MEAEDDAEFVVAFDDESGGEADVGEGSGTEVIRVADVARPVDGREAARARGRAYGEDEARRRGEIGQVREQRIARAVRYAEKEFDGLVGKKAPRPSVDLVASPFRPDFKEGKGKT